ncbi:hypothetical protein [Helicobacter pylori]|nr:hypothetical protein [Helicobacter pylori]
MDSSVFLDALDIGYSFNAKLLWILADTRHTNLHTKTYHLYHTKQD